MASCKKVSPKIYHARLHPDAHLFVSRRLLIHFGEITSLFARDNRDDCRGQLNNEVPATATSSPESVSQRDVARPRVGCKHFLRSIPFAPSRNRL